MNSLLKSAVLNNASWCDAICRLNKAPGTFTNEYWINANKVPDLYPNLITLIPISSDPEKIDDLYSKLKTFKGKGFSIKDSYAELDLRDLKYEKIHESEWIGYEPKRIEGILTRWQRVHFPKRFDKWVEIWKKKNKTEDDLFPPTILKTEDIWICGEYSEEAFSKGAILFIKDNTVGISNIFSNEPIDSSFWEELMGFIAVQFPGATIVGYESGKILRSAIQAGFSSLGQLTVWKK